MEPQPDTGIRRVPRPGGIEVPYTVLGPGTPPRLVFAHALTGSGLLADAVAFGPFLEAGWSVATLDQRGHREGTPSTDPQDYRVEELGADLIAVLDDAGWSSAWLCGASMGAAPSVCAAAAAPERVDGLILLAPAFGAERNAAADMFARTADALAEGGIEAGVAAWEREMQARGLAEAAIAGHLAQLRMHDPAAMTVWLREMAEWTIPDALRDVQRLDVPVAAVAWEDDDIHPADLARRIAGDAPRGACTIIDLSAPDGGPDLLFRTALETIARLPDGPPSPIR